MQTDDASFDQQDKAGAAGTTYQLSDSTLEGLEQRARILLANTESLDRHSSPDMAERHLGSDARIYLRSSCQHQAESPDWNSPDPRNDGEMSPGWVRGPVMPRLAFGTRGPRSPSAPTAAYSKDELTRSQHEARSPRSCAQATKPPRVLETNVHSRYSFMAGDLAEADWLQSLMDFAEDPVVKWLLKRAEHIKSERQRRYSLIP